MTATATRPQPQTRTVEQTAPAVTETPLLDKVLEQSSDILDRLAQRYALAVADPLNGKLKRAMILADGILRLRAAITPPIMERVLQLMNTPLGFMCDRPSKQNPQAYHPDVVRDCFIVSLLEGVPLTGNHWNIIAGKCYITQNGYEYKVLQIPGISDVEIIPGIPVVHNGHTVCRVSLRWKKDGLRGQLIGTDDKPGQSFPIATNSGSTADNTIGKAKRKAWLAAFKRITGSTQTCDDGEIDDETPPAEAKLAQQQERAAEVLASLPTSADPPAKANGNGHAPRGPSKATLSKLREQARTLTLEPAALTAWLAEHYQVESVEQLTPERADQLMREWQEAIAERQAIEGE